MIGEFKKKCWNYLAIEHEKNRTLGKTYMNIYINNDHSKSFAYENTKMSSDQIINTFTFAENMICRISSIIVFKAPLERKLSEIFTYFNQGKYKIFKELFIS
jgi:hypothetical protein